MKLRTKIAGTVALPLALAIASAASAATIVDTDAHRLQIGGFVAAQAYWEMPDAGEMNYGMDLGSSRLGINYTNKTNAGDITYMYEQTVGGRLRHAAILHDGWVAGQSWSFFANLNGLGETLDANGNAITSSWASRNPLLGKNINLGDGMSVGVALEERGTNSGNAVVSGATNASPLPDLTANFKGNFGGVGIFAAAQMYQVNDPTDAKASEGKVRMTASASLPLGDTMGVKAAFTADPDRYSAFSASAQMKMSDQLRTNLVVEQVMDDGAAGDDYMQLWVNAIHKTASGWEWGAEVHMVMGDGTVIAPTAGGAGTKDGDMTFRLQAKYAF
ncbi:MAG: hypothetical protein IBX50_12235 [Marinospirillum sp.]|uniref:hypothetical protein n=1 Tax=Marinospirillum sp. TaxID=2183934 RepID=UPI001A0A8C2A|nr:hypothetical protein [Marinospirillum sp.]MBE0507465.1 hypothetical protein [Marinospirillum sp.]